jgi:hypothetical protein
MINQLFGMQNQMSNTFQIFGGLQNFINQFNAFKQQYNGQVPAQMRVQRLLDSGQMTQQEFNQISQFINLIRRSGFGG